MINKYEAKRDHKFALLEGPVRPEESLDAVKNVDTVDSLSRAFVRAAHVQTRGDAKGATARRLGTNPLMVG